MKKFFLYGICVSFLLVLCSSCRRSQVALPSLKETFSRKDKNAFGAFVLYSELGQFYYRNSIRNVKVNFETNWREINDTGSLYVSISKNLFLSNADLEGMLAYVDNGNSVFISSENIDQSLLDTLGCSVIRAFNNFLADMKYTEVTVKRSIYLDSSSYSYFYFPFYNHFKSFDKQISRTLGNNQSGSNFILVFYGKGRFYLHTEPRALSNYFLLQKNNYKYFENIFSLTAPIPEHVYWDDYYHKRNLQRTEKNSKSGLSVLLQYPAMRWAFYLLLMLFILHILFGGKRRQRVVPPIAANTNTTVAFTETIGRLYLQKKDNRNIADKLITYFFEYIRKQYYLNTSQVNDDFITTLSRKSNNSREATEKLINTIGVVQQSAQISDEQLILLNHQIENFYKN